MRETGQCGKDEEMDGKNKIERNCQNLPFLLNNFYRHLCPTDPINESIIQELGCLAYWIYDKGYSQHLAIDERIYTYLFPEA